MVINIENVTKIYEGPKKSKVLANDNVSLNLKEGEILGLLGHNGAGKTTLVNQIIGITKSTKGKITVLGQNITKNPQRGRFLCSVQPQSQVPIGELTPRQAIRIMGQMRGGVKGDIDREIEGLFDRLDIAEWADTEGTHLSGGVRRLTAFCMAIVNQNQIVILDEPTNDVDPVRRRYLWNEIRNLTNKGVSVILVTHNVLEAESAVDSVVIMDKGKILVQGSTDEVKRSVVNHLRLGINFLKESVDVLIPKWVITSRKESAGMVFSMNPSDVVEALQWVDGLIKTGIVRDYTISQTTLEDVYVKLTEEKGRD